MNDSLYLFVLLGLFFLTIILIVIVIRMNPKIEKSQFWLTVLGATLVGLFFAILNSDVVLNFINGLL